MKNKKLLSILLSFLMIITMFPVSVYAEDDFSNSNDDTNETSEYIDKPANICQAIF